MDLSQYLEEEGITLQDFAKKIGVSRTTVTNYKYKYKKPLPAYADKIFRATGGKVTAKDITINENSNEIECPKNS